VKISFTHHSDKLSMQGWKLDETLTNAIKPTYESDLLTYAKIIIIPCIQ